MKQPNPRKKISLAPSLLSLTSALSLAAVELDFFGGNGGGWGAAGEVVNKVWAGDGVQWAGAEVEEEVGSARLPSQRQHR